jgi:hypothetical protein
LECSGSHAEPLRSCAVERGREGGEGGPGAGPRRRKGRRQEERGGRWPGRRAEGQLGSPGTRRAGWRAGARAHADPRRRSRAARAAQTLRGAGGEGCAPAFLPSRLRSLSPQRGGVVSLLKVGWWKVWGYSGSLGTGRLGATCDFPAISVEPWAASSRAELGPGHATCCTKACSLRHTASLPSPFSPPSFTLPVFPRSFFFLPPCFPSLPSCHLFFFIDSPQLVDTAVPLVTLISSSFPT